MTLRKTIPISFLLSLAVFLLAFTAKSGGPLSGSFVQLEDSDKHPASRVVWHHVARALLNPNGTGQVIGYASQIDGVAGSVFNGTPSEATAFFTFRTDTFSLTPLPDNGDVHVTLLSPGTLNVYFNADPANDWKQPDTFSSGQLIATFHRAETMLIVLGSLQTDTASFQLESSKDFTFRGQTLGFETLSPNGINITNSASNTPLLTGMADFPIAFPFGGHAVAVVEQTSSSRK